MCIFLLLHLVYIKDESIDQLGDGSPHRSGTISSYRFETQGISRCSMAVRHFREPRASRLTESADGRFLTTRGTRSRSLHIEDDV